MKRKKAAKLARKFAKIKIELEEFAKIKIELEELADDVQTSLWGLISANYQDRAEAEASILLAKLAGDMEHAEASVHNAEELRGAEACVKQWAERLKQ